MRSSSYLLLAVTILILLAAGCREDDDMPTPLSECNETGVEQLRCVLSQTFWQLESVESDVPRGEGNLANTNWLAFQPGCYANSRFLIPGFAPLTADSLVVLPEVLDVGSNCSSQFVVSMTTGDLLQTAEAVYFEPFALYMFGDTIGQFDNVIETWYDIEYSEEDLTFKVDKELDGRDYTVTVSMTRSE